MKRNFYLAGLFIICFNLLSGAANAQAVVTTDPSSVTGCTGSTKLFGITATGATSYMWQVSTDGGSVWDTVHNGAVYTGATTDTMHVVLAAGLNNYKYRAIAFSTGGNDTSNAATLHVDIPSAGTITGANAVCVGSSIAFTSSVSGGVWSNVFHSIDTITAAGIDTGRSAGMDTIKYSVTNTCGTTTSRKLVRVDNFPSALSITGPTAVCVGNDIVLNNANVTGTFSWSSSNTSQATVGAASGVVHGVSAGFPVISYSFTNACSTVVSTTTIHVETMLSSGTVTGPSSVCHGSLITLTPSVGGGIWLSGTTSVAVVDGSGNVTGVSQGTSIISYYFSNSCGAAFTAHTVTVDIPASPIGGNDSVGIDSNLVLSNAAPGGIWSSADATIASIGSTGIVHGVDTGATTITYSVSNSCGLSSATIAMNVGPLPYGGVISGPDSVCVGSSITLVDTTGYGPVVSWSSQFDTVATVSPAGVVSGVSYGTVNIRAVVRTAFGQVTVTKPVFVNQPPVVTLTHPSPVSYGGSYAFSVTPTGGTFATTNSSVVHFTSYGNFVVLGYGTAIVTYSVTNTCGTTVAHDTVSLEPAGVHNIAGNAGALQVFPNPSNGAVKMLLTSANNEPAHIVVANATGTTIKELDVKTNTNEDVNLDLPSGVYFITASTERGEKHSVKLNLIH
jgi:hypothetical protein